MSKSKTSTKKAPAAKSAAKKSSSKKKPATSAKGDAKNITIRMYNVGFGDSFLLLIPNSADPSQPLKVLIDCGVHNSGRNPGFPIDDAAKQIVKDVTEGDGIPRIDLVIVTHRHQDHVSGFSDSTIWETVEVKEVWLPWTEDYTDPEARKILETQSKVAKSLTASLAKRLTALAASPAAAAATKALKELAENSLTNAAAMATIHKGFAGNPKRRYLPFKTRNKNSFLPAMLPGVTAHIMGPSRDPDTIRDMDPPAGHSYLRLMESTADGSDTPHLPFHPSWRLENDECTSGEYTLSTRDLKAIENVGEGDSLAVTVALDKAVNGTSLMIMFEVGKAHLFFPGDAQWGTWKAAMNDPEWRELMTKTNFYKIGHHGSHNATPIDFVEQILGAKFSAMASVRPVKAWKFIPKKELMEHLREKCLNVVRSDKADVKDPEGFTRTDTYVETKIPI